MVGRAAYLRNQERQREKRRAAKPDLAIPPDIVEEKTFQPRRREIVQSAYKVDWVAVDACLDGGMSAVFANDACPLTEITLHNCRKTKPVSSDDLPYPKSST